MKNLLFDRRLMNEVGDEGGSGGGGSAVDTGAQDTGAVDAPASAHKGALSGVADEGTEGSEGATSFDFENGTQDDYFSKVSVEGIDGMEFSMENAKKNWGEFLMENKITPEVFSKFVALEGKYQKEMSDAIAKEEAKAVKAAEARMQAEDEAFHKEFNPEQITSMVSAAKRDFGGDKAFIKAIGTELASNSSIGKLLLFWAEGHKADTVPGGGVAQHKPGFAARWTGNPKY